VSGFVVKDVTGVVVNGLQWDKTLQIRLQQSLKLSFGTKGKVSVTTSSGRSTGRVSSSQKTGSLLSKRMGVEQLHLDRLSSGPRTDRDYLLLRIKGGLQAERNEAPRE